MHFSLNFVKNITYTLILFGKMSGQPTLDLKRDFFLYTLYFQMSKKLKLRITTNKTKTRLFYVKKKKSNNKTMVVYFTGYFIHSMLKIKLI